MATTGAAIIATFYGPLEKRADHVPADDRPLAAIVRRLSHGLALKSDASTRDEWLDAGETLFLQRFNPPAASDTTVVQLAMNEPGDVVSAWMIMRERLEGILDIHLLTAIWGYSLIYQADLGPDEEEVMVLDESPPAVTRLYAPSPTLAAANTRPLATARLDGGHVLLMEVPLSGDGAEAATVYAALSRPNSGNVLVQRALFGTSASLTMPDLIAHKAYHQIRQYRGHNRLGRFRTQLTALRDATDLVLSRTGRAALDFSLLDGLTRHYRPLVSVVSNLEALRISLRRQEANYDWWRARSGAGNVAEFHRSHIDIAIKELDLLVTEGREVLASARVAVEIVRARIEEDQRQLEQERVRQENDRAQQERQRIEREHSREQQRIRREEALERERRRRQDLFIGSLSVMAVALAVPQMFTAETACAFLNWDNGPQQPCGHGRLSLLLVQIAVTLAVAGLVGLLWFLIARAGWSAERQADSPQSIPHAED